MDILQIDFSGEVNYSKQSFNRHIRDSRDSGTASGSTPLSFLSSFRQVTPDRFLDERKEHAESL